MSSIDVFAYTDEQTDVAALDSTMNNTSESQPAKKTFWMKVKKIVRDFSTIDTTYIEPQHYNYAFMMQNTNTFESYRLSSTDGQLITFSPDPTYRIGPYFGWRWLFLGYTLDIAHLGGGGSSKQDFTLSLYSNQIGVDLFWRKSGSDYKLRNVQLASDINTSALENEPFGDFRATVRGLNLYYITNHRKFSYPAAYSQSTVQRRSVGSFLLGLGYTWHSLEVDWQKFNSLVERKLQLTDASNVVDTTLLFSRVEYTDLSFTVGYTYNWVFAHNWLFNISLSTGLAYKHSSSNAEHSSFSLRNFDFKNFNLDETLRTGIVWNNTKWYAGMSAIFHSYNYRKSQFSTTNTFGNLNFYVGFNFSAK